MLLQNARIPSGWLPWGFVVLVLGHANAWSSEPPQETPEFAIVAYLPEYHLDRVDPERAKGLTDLIFFSIEAKDDGKLDARKLTDRALAKIQAFKKQNGTRLELAIGGWGRSRGFARLSADPEARARFVGECVTLCLEKGFDGIDLDWEHPRNDTENRGYAQLLVDLKRAFVPRKLRLSAALAGWQNPGEEAYKAVDFLHLMAYDHDGPRHSTLEHAQGDTEAFLERGVPASKIRLGIPFYGRSMRKPSTEASYQELCRRYRPRAADNEAGGFFFNGPDLVSQKTRFAREKKLSGVMIWDLGQDAEGESSLLQMIVQSAR